METLMEFPEKLLSAWRQLSARAKASKRAAFPFMTKTGQADR
jgi:hypothetical protein